MLRPHVRGDELEGYCQNRRIIGETERRQEIRNHVGRNDEIGECRENHGAHARRRCRIESAEIRRESSSLQIELSKEVLVNPLPADVKNPRLDIREGYGVDHVIEAVLIGDEDSILHKRNYFKLDMSNQVVSY